MDARFASALVAIVLGWSVPCAAQSDPGAARAQLEKGYALKQQGKCAEAIPYFEESVRLDRAPKNLLNLADCEEKSGRLLQAQAHFLEARDLARQRGMHEPASYAEQRARALDERLPKIAVKLAADAPTGTVVLRDGVELGAVSLGVPLPVDPGTHTIVARAQGYERTFQVFVAEAESKVIEVTPRNGSPVPATGAEPARAPVSPSSSPSPSSSAATSTAASPPAPSTPEHDDRAARSTSPARTGVLIGEAALVAVGLTAAVVFELKAMAAQDDADSLRSELTSGGAEYPCDASSPPSACRRLTSKLDDRNTFRGISRAGAITAGVGAAAFVATWFLWRPASDRGLDIRPAVSLQSAGITVDWRHP